MALFNIYDDTTPTNDLRDQLGWWNHSGSDDTSELVAFCMILCDRVGKLERRVVELERGVKADV